jgi:hypothetical protein
MKPWQMQNTGDSKICQTHHLWLYWFDSTQPKMNEFRGRVQNRDAISRFYQCIE